MIIWRYCFIIEQKNQLIKDCFAEDISITMHPGYEITHTYQEELACTQFHGLMVPVVVLVDSRVLAIGTL